MATKQTILWTALPNGWAAGASTPTLRLSVFVSARLETNEGLPKPTLVQFPDLLQWTAKVQEMSFTVQFDPGASVAAQRVGAELEPALWTALCKPSTYVKPYQPPNQFAGRIIRSHPVANVSSFLKSQYQSVATGSPTTLLPREQLIEKLTPVSMYSPPSAEAVGAQVQPGVAAGAKGAQTPPRALKSATPGGQAAAQAQLHPQFKELSTFSQSLNPKVRASALKDANVLLANPSVNLRPQTVDAFKSVAQDLQQFRAVRPGTTPQPTRDFLEVALYHRPPLYTRLPLEPPEIDFHQFLSSLGNYPELMRHLGLVIDLEVPVPEGFSTSGTVRVVPAWTPTAGITTTDFTPKTAYVTDKSAQTFMAAPGPDAKTVDGMLKLNDDFHPVLSYDVDGAALKTISLVDHLQTQAARAARASKAQLSTSQLSVAPLQVRSEAVALDKAAPPAQGQTQVMSAPLAAKAAESQAVTPQITMLRAAPAAGKAAAAAPRPTLEALPPLRSAGISVAETGRALAMAKAMEKVTGYNQAVQTNKPEDVIFHAEDVMRGYRVDIWDSDTKSWRSLCRRKGSYHFLEGNLTREYEDEGWVQVAVTQSADKSSPEPTDDLYLHESMFRWDGWSLAAPRPGKHLDPKGMPARGDDPNTLEKRASTDFKLVTEFKVVPGSLPKLRFGVAYRVRARAVDLAGNGLSLDAVKPDDFSQATPPHPYTRFEPVVTPLTILTRPGVIHCNMEATTSASSPGESLDHVVVRSNFDKSVEEYALLFGNLTKNPDYPPSPERLMVPPKTSQIMAERHGMFDSFTGGMKNASETYEIIRQRADAAIPVDALSKCPLQPGLEVPYLPDPLARGASVVLLDRQGNQIGSPRMISFFPPDSEWPAARGFKIKVVEGKDKTSWDWNEGDRLLTVSLPKAEVVTLRISSYFGEGDRGRQNQEQMGVWNWIQEGNPTNKSALQELAIGGRHWMMTPFKDILLTHPVQQPLTLPQFHQLTPSRLLGATYSYVGDDKPMPIDGKSTVKVDIMANWEDPIDDVTKPEPFRTSSQAQVFEYQMTPDDQDISQTLEPIFNAEINRDIRRIALAPAVIGSAMVQPAVQTQNLKVEKKPSRAVVQQAPVAPTAQLAPSAQVVTPSAAVMATEFKIPPHIVVPLLPTKTGYSWRHDFGDTKYHKVNYQAVAATRFREYFPASTPEQPVPLTRVSEPVAVDVPNSARPASPKILYVLPTFGWERKTDVIFSKKPGGFQIPGTNLEGVGTVSKRTGGALRVYLDRPWYSSGDGELLGIVLWPGPAPPSGGAFVATMVPSNQPPDLLKPYATQWGMDPIWYSDPTREIPAIENFTKNVANQTGLTLDEFPPDSPVRVNVAGHAVEYDKERKLWYCDIEIDLGTSYFPFVRLALARFQPKSVPNAHLSRVMLADFAQLAPDRTATIVFDRKNLKEIEVAVSGPGYKSSAAGRTGNELEVTLETQPVGAEGDLGWIPVSRATFPLKPAQATDASLWRGTVRIPKLPKLQAARLVIKEYEPFVADQGSKTQKVRRLVYADVLKIPALYVLSS